MEIQGQFYTSSGSQGRPASLTLAGGHLRLELDAPRETRELQWHDLEVSPRVGNTPRYLQLPGGGVLETRDNDRVDELARSCHQGVGARLVHRLENHLGLILAAVAVTLLVTVMTFTHGIPWASSLVANALPESLSRQMGESSLAQLDELWLSPSQLPVERQQALRAHFAPLLATEQELDFRVVFRDGGIIGANALALPDGTLVFTDQMVALAESPHELSAILAHEMGHVVERHGLQGVVQSSLVAWVIVVMTGDLSAASDLVVVAPAILMDLSYSRDMEWEADGYALTLMQQQGLDPAHFARIMSRLEASHGETGEQDHEQEREGWSERLGGALSTHPLTRERIERFERASSPSG